MRSRNAFAAAVVLINLCSVAQAQWRDQPPVPTWPSLNDPAARRHHVPSVRAATTCIAREIMSAPGIVDAYKAGNVEPLLEEPIRRCWPAVTVMLSEGDRIYGPGMGGVFYRGPYLSDLPRAVMVMIKPMIADRQAEEARQEAQRKADEAVAEQAQRDAQAKADEEARIADERRKAEEEEAKTIALQKEEEHRKQLDVAKGSMSLLRDEAYSCLSEKVKSLVRSGESSDVISSAAMTICGPQIDPLIKSLVDVYNIENNASISGGLLEDAIVEKAKNALKEQALALAVQAKASQAH